MSKCSFNRNLPFILENNKADVILVPRVNTVVGLTQDHIDKWKWNVNEKGWVNWPDYQWRIYKNTPNIKWKGKVHEILEGYKEYAYLPMEEEYVLYHPKTIEKTKKNKTIIIIHYEKDLDVITFCISTYNNLLYLKLAVDSVRKNSFFKDAPFIIHAENCTDGTNEWIKENQVKYNLTLLIEPNNKIVKGIGGGMNICAENVKTEYIMFLHSDFYVTKDWDIECLRIFKNILIKTLGIIS